MTIAILYLFVVLFVMPLLVDRILNEKKSLISRSSAEIRRWPSVEYLIGPAEENDIDRSPSVSANWLGSLAERLNRLLRSAFDLLVLAGLILLLYIVLLTAEWIFYLGKFVLSLLA